MHETLLTTPAYAAVNSKNPDDASCDVWGHVIRALCSTPDAYRPTGERRKLRNSATRGAGRTDARSPQQPQAQVQAQSRGQSCNAQIEVLERLSPRAITILWQDATRCRYVDQVWTRCRARAIGRCAITGTAIGRDDIVFKPRARAAYPGNARAMILASAIDSGSLES